MKKMIDCLIRSIPLSAAIIGIAYFITYVLLSNPQKLDLTLFVLGGVPIILFLPSVFSQSKSGALHTPKVIFRRAAPPEVSHRPPHEDLFPALSYVIAGFLTWIFSSIIY